MVTPATFCLVSSPALPHRSRRQTSLAKMLTPENLLSEFPLPCVGLYMYPSRHAAYELLAWARLDQRKLAVGAGNGLLRPGRRCRIWQASVAMSRTLRRQENSRGGWIRCAACWTA